MKIKITSDSTSDLSQALLEKFDIAVSPLYIIKDGQSYRDNIDITTDDIFAHVKAGGGLCSTAAVSETDYEEFFRRETRDCDGLVHVTISAEISSCYQNACVVAKRFPNVEVVDSRNLSTGIGHVVLFGAELAQRGDQTAAQIAQAMRAITEKVDASFVVDRLDYLRKGGRCSAVAALGANLLSIKPCIEVKNGQMGLGKKYRGAYEKALRAYVRDRLQSAGPVRQNRIFITHTAVPDDIVEAVRQEVNDCMHFDEVLITRAGCTVGCHCGPMTLGILYVHE